MEINSHPSFPQPANPGVKLWRYMDAPKFEWLLQERRLYMPTADRVSDHLEGTTPQAEIDWWDAKVSEATDDEQRAVYLHNRRFFADMAQAMRKRYFISCWHMNEYENNVMWGAYTSSTDAVAIATTFSALRGQIPAFVYLGQVRYIDFDTTRFLESMPNMFEWIMHKEAVFQSEAEVRAVVYPPASDGFGLTEFNASTFVHVGEPDRYLYAPIIDPALLVQAVVTHPRASPEFIAKIETSCETHGLPKPVRSRGSRAPVF